MRTGPFVAAPCLILAVACGASSTAPRSAPRVKTVERGGLVWIDNDADAAFAEAKRLDRPVLVDLWAPWCTPCLVMRTFVLNAETMGKDKDRFVWLEIDTEDAKNAAFLSRHRVIGLPSFRIIDHDGTERLRQDGVASGSKFRRFLAEGLRAVELARAGTSDEVAALVAQARDDQAHGRFPEALVRLREALKRAPAGSPQRANIALDLGFGLLITGQASECLDVLLPAAEAASGTDRAMPFGLGMACTMQLPENDGRRASTLNTIARELEPLCAGQEPDVTRSERAFVCQVHSDALEALGQKDAARRSAERALSHVREATAKLPVELAVAEDDHIVWALSRLGRTDEAIALLTEHERALPRDYNPPTNLALQYKEQKKWDLSLAAIDRAMARCEGPYRATLLDTKMEILLAADRKDEARAVLVDRIAFMKSVPDSQRHPGQLEGAEQRLAEWK